jgi:ADP-L-glycero-D-manno-heptose 6-epimerase
MIVITGAAGFIGSCLAAKLNNKGIRDLVLVDDFSNPEKSRNTAFKTFRHQIERSVFVEWLRTNHKDVEFVFHIGARTDTTEFRKEIFDELNVNYSKAVWYACTEFSIPMVYASSAATYGMGENGYSDSHDIVDRLRPLNPYGESKNEFDKWVLRQAVTPPFWAGLKFFNVYGPNEYHKGRMASVIFHTWKQIGENGRMCLFRSHNPEYGDGKQLRDFVYVKDVADICFYLYQYRMHSGLYNIGTGKARTFLDLANATFRSLGKAPVIEFIDTPADIRDKYQYFTEADIHKLRSIGYNVPFYSLEDGIEDYVQGYLMGKSYY